MQKKRKEKVFASCGFQTQYIINATVAEFQFDNNKLGLSLNSSEGLVSHVKKKKEQTGW